jgi:AMMECR1 domain-containing protein
VQGLLLPLVKANEVLELPEFLESCAEKGIFVKKQKTTIYYMSSTN